MPQVLAIAETRAGTLRDVSLELITAGRDLIESAGGHLTVAIADSDPSRYIEALTVPGVERIITASTGTDHFESHVAAATLRRAIASARPDVVLLAHSVDSMAFAPAVAATLETGFASDVMSLDWKDELIVRRGSHSDKLVAELDFPGKETAILMVRPGAFAASTGAGSTPEIIDLDAPAEPPLARHVGFHEPETSDIDITKADFLLSVGRGIEEEEDVARFEALAEKLGATLSSSRPLVDAGWLPSARQVGQSGKTVKPKVYLALGISGAVQHLAGIRGAETIIAVNKDPAAPIFSLAHYGAVADMFEVAEELEKVFG